MIACYIKDVLKINLSQIILPLIVLFIILYGIYKKVPIYDVFLEGAKESFSLIMSMFPCMLAMVLGVNIFLKSGFLNFVFEFLNPLLQVINLPLEILPLAFIRPISGSSSLAILASILKKYGPDSFIGRMASIMQGSTDTTFYILTLYYGSVGIKKIRYSLIAGLGADIAGIVSALVLTQFLF